MLWEENQINYKVIPTSLFRGCPLIKSPDEWATTKQACRDDLVVYLIFLPQHKLFRIYITSDNEVVRKNVTFVNIF